MVAQFAARGVSDTLGMELWLDTQNNAWLPTHPDKDGNCRFLMATTVRDFSREHPDFDFGSISGDFTAPGLVENTIGADRRRGFYPIDDFNRHAETINTCAVSPDGIQYYQTGFHNLNFCMETHATFTYRKGQRFESRGDDAFWVFINDKLVIELGGLHKPLADTVDLDTLGLAEGGEYRWDMFLCDRQPCTSSLRFKTSISFRPQKTLEAIEDPARRGTCKVVRREGGAGSCAGQGDSSKVVPATDLPYQLWDTAGKVVWNYPKIRVRPPRRMTTERVDAGQPA